MVKFRKEFDANRAEKRMEATDHPTEKNQFEVYCDMCGEMFFVDEIMFEKVNDAIREGFDNPFVCANCRDELDELAYSER